MVSSYLPHPLYSGGQVRLYNLLKKLSPKHDITLICEMRSSQIIDDIKEVEKYCKKVITVQRKKQWSLKNIIKTAFSTKSFLYNGHKHSQMRDVINEELESGKYDLIHAETYYIMQNIPNLVSRRIPIVLVEHNIEYMVYTRFVKTAPFWIRPVLNIDIAKIKNEEQKAWERAEVLAAVSAADKKVMEDAGFSAEIVPNGVDEDIYKLKDYKSMSEKQEKRILFIGDFKWIQNQDSAKWIISEIWPKISQKILKSASHESSKTPQGGQKDNVKLWIVGRKIPESIRRLTDDPDIVFDEESSAKPAYKLFQSAYLLLSPIRVGGGTSYKIIESMACGTPVIMTGLSADALGIREELPHCIGETSNELSGKAVGLIEDRSLYEKSVHISRELVLKNYTWNKINEQLDKIYRNV